MATASSPFATDHLIQVAYLIATALFILSLKWLSTPATARRGVLAGEVGMALAIGGTLLDASIVDYRWIAMPWWSARSSACRSGSST